MDYEKVIAERDSLQQENIYLRKEIEQLKRLIFGSRQERYVPQEADSIQLSLFDEETKPQVSIPEKEKISYERNKPVKKHPGRNEIPEHFEVEEIVIEPEGDVTGMVKVGEQITEYVEYVSASIKKIRLIRPTYAPKEGEGSFVIAELPSRALPKSIAGEGLLTYMIIRKFIEHMPFYRQIQSIKREYEWEIPSSTINDWFAAVCTLLEPLYKLLKEKVLDSGYLQVDESPIKVQDADKKGATHRGYQWVYHSPEEKLVYFDYRKGRGENGPKRNIGKI